MLGSPQLVSAPNAVQDCSGTQPSDGWVLALDLYWFQLGNIVISLNKVRHCDECESRLKKSHPRVGANQFIGM
jgi:hypothetical protein